MKVLRIPGISRGNASLRRAFLALSRVAIPRWSLTGGVMAGVLAGSAAIPNMLANITPSMA
jgi:hypothetical protein